MLSTKTTNRKTEADYCIIYGCPLVCLDVCLMFALLFVWLHESTYLILGAVIPVYQTFFYIPQKLLTTNNIILPKSLPTSNRRQSVCLPVCMLIYPALYIIYTVYVSQSICLSVSVSLVLVETQRAYSKTYRILATWIRIFYYTGLWI